MEINLDGDVAEYIKYYQSFSKYFNLVVHTLSSYF